MTIKEITGLVLMLATGLGVMPAFAQENIGVPSPLSVSLETVQGDNILRHVKRLASDEFEGRAPGTPGEDLTVKYLIEQFREIGAEPGNPDRTYFQNVPLVGYRTMPKIDLTVDGKAVPFAYLDDFVHDYPRLTPKVRIPSAEVVFAGYGITAPSISGTITRTPTFAESSCLY